MEYVFTCMIEKVFFNTKTLGFRLNCKNSLPFKNLTVRAVLTLEMSLNVAIMEMSFQAQAYSLGHFSF